MKKLLFFVLAIASFQVSYSQLVVSNPNTPAYYVQNILLGTGVTASNITFNGAPGNTPNAQIGQFNAINTNPYLGIDSGIVMASGDVNVAVGPNNSGSASLGGGNLGASDPDLDQLEGTGSGTNDKSILEFDFIPTGDTITFNFIFGSEEYPEWVSAGYNDAFGFFLSGPGIAGPYSNSATNIALIPGTTTPVTIDNVNSASNPSYYIDNTPFSGAQSIQFDGYTTPITAVGLVQCGLLYHIKLAIADVGDAIYDSGVFLEGGSFSSNNTMDATTANVPSDVFICNPPFDVNFSSGPTPPPNSYWDFGDSTGTSTQQNPTYTYADSGSYVVMYVAYDQANPCVLPDTAYFNVNIVQTGALDAQIDIPPYDPCDDSLTIALQSSGSGADSIYWDLGDGTTIPNNTPDTIPFNHTYTVNGDYIVTFEAYEFACGGFNTVIDTIHFNPVFTTVTATAPPPISLCSSPYTVDFTGNVPSPPQAYWDFMDTTGTDTSTLLNPQYTYPDTGTYIVQYVAIDSNTCNIADTAYFTVTVNLADTLSANFSVPPYDPCDSSFNHCTTIYRFRSRFCLLEFR